MLRKLPVYLLLDVSGSMAVEGKREALREGLLKFKQALVKDPYALSRTRVSLITFGQSVCQTIPPTEIEQFVPPTLAPCGPTPLGAALRLAVECAQREVVVASQHQKGDWKPLVFLLTDGKPTDDPETFQECLQTFKSYPWGKVVACGIGAEPHFEFLRSITRTIVQLEIADASTVHSFFELVSKSVLAYSDKESLNAPEDAPSPPTKRFRFFR